MFLLALYLTELILNRNSLMKTHLLYTWLLCSVLLTSTNLARANTIIDLKGVVDSSEYYMGSGFRSPPFKIGATFTGQITLAGGAVQSLIFEIQKPAGGVYRISQTKFNGWTTSVTPGLISASNVNFLQRWSFDPASGLFSYNNNVLSENERNAYKFQVRSPIPDGGATAVLLTGAFIGLGLARRRGQG